jgi:hypothetical protein
MYGIENKSITTSKQYHTTLHFHQTSKKTRALQGLWKNSPSTSLDLSHQMSDVWLDTWIKAYTAGFERWFYYSKRKQRRECKPLHHSAGHSEVRRLGWMYRVGGKFVVKDLEWWCVFGDIVVCPW